MTSSISRAVPIVSIFNQAAPGANTDIATDFNVDKNVTALRISVALTTGSVFNIACRAGATEHIWGLNSSTALNAGDAYTFTIGCRRYDDGLETGTLLTYNFQVETDSVIEMLMVEGVTGGAL